MVPRPLAKGQTWSGGEGETWKFKGIEDVDFYDESIKDCAVVERTDGEKIVRKFYRAGSGLILTESKINGVEVYFRHLESESGKKVPQWIR